MVTELSDKQELTGALSDTVSKMQDLIKPLDEEKINAVPYKDSWTAGQLFNHVTKSIAGLADAMKAPVKAAERDPGEKIPALKKTFLDFSHKMKSPDFIVPEDGPFKKNAVTSELNNAVDKLTENTGDAKLNGLVEGLPFGPTTKLELLHFVVYHTQRHLHQLKKIYHALTSTQGSEQPA